MGRSIAEINAGFAAVEARDRGIKRVLDNNLSWAQRAIIAAMSIKMSKELKREFTGEDLRMKIAELIGNPSHPNAWGGLIQSLTRKGIIEFNGKMRRPVAEKSHARAIMCYNWVN